MDPFTNAGNGAPHPEWPFILLRLALSLVGGLVVSAIYKNTRPKSHINPSFPPTLVLLAILIAISTQVIGSNVARAFSLVGALSIVRFRTVVRDTQDTAFVIFAVVEGMAIGAGSYLIAPAGLAIAGFAAFLVRTRVETAWVEFESMLHVRLGIGADAVTLLAPAFNKSVEAHDVLNIATVQKGAAIDYTYRVRLKAGADPAAFVKELNQLDGVQGVELKRGEPDPA
jgi:hypothetical protein